MTDESIKVKVDVQGDCDESETWVLVTQNGYLVAILSDDAVKDYDLMPGQTFEMKLISP